MIKRVVHILLLFLLGCVFTLNAQTNLPAEYAQIFSSRSVYISGEEIEFYGTIKAVEPFSKIVYIELITPTGSKISQSKWALINGHFSGILEIPKESLSGFYLVRAYTKWMRNGSPDNYATILVKIINPYSNELQKVPDSLIDSALSDVSKIEKDYVEIAGLKDEYKQEERLMLGDKLSGLSNVSIGIIPLLSVYNFENIDVKEKIAFSEITHYPETRGISLSGKLKSKKSQKLLPFHLINLNIIGEHDFHTVLTDSLGRFHFALPKTYGEKELFLIAETIEGDEVEILIDQDFCNQAVGIQVPEFIIHKKEESAILLMAQNHQVSELFFKADSVDSVQEMEQEAFYGEAFKTLDFSFYIPLDSLEVYFTDLPSWVQVRKEKGKRQFSLVGDQGELRLYKPLVLVDWVPVDDVERVLAIQPQQVEKIDIINKAYVHGEIIYGGVIHILTHKTDFGGIKFPKSGMYLRYDFLSNDTYQKPEESAPKNTSLWIPNFKWNTDKVKLETPKERGHYLIQVQGLDVNGEKVSLQKEFEVKL